ncbi:hypothetical protein C9J01_10250 [Photobacterium rosenbergii]|uniref:Uncharacterized protein n=1 Tax=Photobacterium rosenbergii TaxID=294936 RepID=A0A2T3NF88_9GAMM|nr:hypothetical protein C9J01_10250 [Photobacterium rosenbergii]
MIIPYYVRIKGDERASIFNILIKMPQSRSGGRSNEIVFELDGVKNTYRNITNTMFEQAREIKWVSGDSDKRNHKKLYRYQSKITNWSLLVLLGRKVFNKLNTYQVRSKGR